MNSPCLALIDDDRVWLETLADYLGDQGFEVRTALGGTRGLHLLDHEEIGLAVVDFHMPDLDGMELLRYLRRQRRNVDVLLMSSDDDPTLPQRALAEGAAGFLTKSQSPRQLLRSLVQTLTLTLAEIKSRPLRTSRWDRFLPVPRRREIWLPILWSPEDPGQN
jgi:DNA-binding NarL/FixJ family response regulator